MPDYKAIAKIKDSMKGYEFHCLDPPEQWRLVHYLPSSEETIHRKDLLGCLEKAIEYVHQHNIDAVIFCSDYSSLMAAALCQETGLPGPSFESKFLCMHKYYSRKAEPSRLWYGCVSVDKNQNVDINSWVKSFLFWSDGESTQSFRNSWITLTAHRDASLCSARTLRMTS